MAEPRKRRAGPTQSKATKKSAPEETETVLAAELNVGEHIFFPNSRRAQAIESIVDEEQDGRSVRRIIAAEGSVSWLLSQDTEIRRQKEA